MHTTCSGPAPQIALPYSLLWTGTAHPQTSTIPYRRSPVEGPKYPDLSNLVALLEAPQGRRRARKARSAFLEKFGLFFGRFFAPPYHSYHTILYLSALPCTHRNKEGILLFQKMTLHLLGKTENP